MAWKSIILDEPKAHNNILLVVCPRLIWYMPLSLTFPVFLLCKAYSFHVSMVIIAIILKIWLQRVDIKIVMGYVDLIHTFHFGTKWNISTGNQITWEEERSVLFFCWTTFFLKELIKNWVFSLAAAVHTRTPPTTRVREVYKGQGNVKLKAEYPKVRWVYKWV